MCDDRDRLSQMTQPEPNYHYVTYPLFSPNLDLAQIRREKTNMGRSKRKANQKTTAATVSDLPNHIMCDILSRLPLDSIFTCKRVCKIWHNLILEPCFAKLHLSRSPLSLVFFRHSNTNNSPSYFEILQLNDPPDLDQHNATMKFRTEIYFPHRYVQIVASCNGSILLSNWASPYSNDLVIIVCNPLRGHHLIVPVPPKLALRTHHFAGLGFVHSSSTNTYKVLIFTRTHNPARLYCDTFTIGIDDEWRSIGDTGKPPAVFPSQFVFLNGALHWIGFENSRVICYFDIEKEQFGSFPLPSLFEEGRIWLGVVDNWLYIHHGHPYHLWKFWVMKDYGDFGSWTLECVIEGSITHGRPVKLLKMLKDGTLLMILKRFSSVSYSSQGKITMTQGKIIMTLASYNIQTRVLKMIEYSDMLSMGHSLSDAPCFFSPMDALQ
ncbi:hypothetical protein Vadar_031977 [Vaccinium darrowii]|uniref:Uncharacterized protein n=1 Tax=Vaccinium darrowii TaxID=229202 RepID=A0ACB7XW49_9ERIC|nr:hypothetical protein Vadar_031977 [Vaccinium darrowii]